MDLSIVMRKSRIFYDFDGECWILFHVPENVDIGELSSTLWGEYCRYLERVHKEFNESTTLGASGPAGQDHDVFSGVVV